MIMVVAMVLFEALLAMSELDFSLGPLHALSKAWIHSGPFCASEDLSPLFVVSLPSSGRPCLVTKCKLDSSEASSQGMLTQTCLQKALCDTLMTGWCIRMSYQPRMKCLHSLITWRIE